MGDFKKVPISFFLSERSGRYKPNDPKIDNFRRLDKINFSGEIHLSDKPTKTDMIIVEPGDLVLSGINVAKGAIAVYDGQEPIVATIHYSSYVFNKQEIEISYFKRYLKSPAFIQELQSQVKGGIKTEIKAKHLLPIVIELPDITIQQEINSHFESFENELTDLGFETEKQEQYIALLRQSILQEAIKGKLTEVWRKKNPICKGDPETDASVLLEQIKTEKYKLFSQGKIRKEKSLVPIKPEDIPFALPEEWVWTRLGEICDFITKGTTPAGHEMKNMGEIPYLKVYNIVDQKIDFLYKPQYISKKVHDKLQRSKVFPGDVLMNIVGPPLGKVAIVPDSFSEWNINQALAIFRSIRSDINPYIYLFLNEGKAIKSIQTFGVVGQDNISLAQCRDIIISIPPLAEQRAIIERVDRLLAMVDELEKQVSKRKKQAEGLMQAVLREAFE